MLPVRRSTIRLRGFDYTLTGVYFVTLCLQDRLPLFGRCMDEKVGLTAIGEIAHEEWRRSSEVRKEVTFDTWILMPDHLHGIVAISADRRERGIDGRSRSPYAKSLGSFVAGFKASTTRRLRDQHLHPGCNLWQRGYYERIIRNDDELHRFRKYISENPARWASKHQS